MSRKVSSAMAEPTARRPSRAQVKAGTRARLIRSTIDVIAEKGFAGTTLADVAHRTGMSRGIVNFHFASKEQLLAATLAYMADEYQQVFERVMRRAGRAPAARLAALLKVDFHPTLCTGRKIMAWRAFWAESRARPAFRRQRDTLDARYFREAEALCARLIDHGDYTGLDAAIVARGLNAMIDGLLDEIMMHPEAVSRAAARRVCLTFLAGLFPKDFTAPGR
ncbi:MAG: TetR family transcriptional regulator [Alphaproteobacteria bacterium]|nr:TetR family transcriptional regulator [Alphaproteobacteria bacterium]